MAALTSTSFASVNGVATATVNTASVSDTITYVKGSNQLLELDNTTAGSLTLNVKGSAPNAAYPVPNTSTTVDLSTGLNIVVPASTKKIVNLDKISAYLDGNGTVTLSGAATLKITVYA